MKKPITSKIKPSPSSHGGPAKAEETNKAIAQHRILKLSNLSIAAGVLSGGLLIVAITGANPSTDTPVNSGQDGHTKITVDNNHDSADSDSESSESTVKESGSSSTDSHITSTVEGGRTHIKIESKTETLASGQSSTSTGVTLNGQTLNPDKNGRINETFKDDDSKTRIRGRIKSSGDSSINIQTSETHEQEVE